MRVITNFKTTLSASITSSQTTIPLSSITTTDGHTIAIADLDALNFMALEPGSAKMELISFTGITDNGDGSGILTGVTRGLAFYGSTTTAVTANQYSHQAGVTITLSNIHYDYDQLMDLDSNETVTGIKTFSTTPKITNAPTASTDASNKAYVDLVAGGHSTTNQILVSGFAGEGLTAGWAVYLKTSDGKWYGTQASDATKCNGVIIGIAQTTVLVSAAVNVLVSGLDSNQTGLTPGATYYLSDSKGLIASSAGTISVTIGVCDTVSTELLVSPRFTQVPTALQLTYIPSTTQKDALAGSLGTPSSTNPYVTSQQVTTVTAMAAQAIDGTAGSIFTRTLAASETFTQSGFTAGRVFMVEVKQGSGTTYSVTWFAGITWVTTGATAPDQTQTTNGISTYGFRCTGTNTFLGYLISTQ